MKRIALPLALGLCLTAPVFAEEDKPGPAVGTAAPVAEVVDQDGEAVDLAAAYEKGPVLLFFYPKAGTGG